MVKYKLIISTIICLWTSLLSAQNSDNSNFLNGLISAYSLENNSNIIDEQGTNDGTAIGVSSVVGSIGNALNFTGLPTSMITIPESTSLNLNGTEFTIMVDIYPTSNGQSGVSVILQKGYETSGNNIYSVAYNSSNKVRFRTFTNGIQRDFVSTATAPLNTWSRVICTWKSGEPKTIKINTITNTDVAAYSGTQTVNTGRDLTIGSYDVSPASNTRSFVGRMDNVMIWNKALTSAEQNTLVNDNLGYNDFSTTTEPSTGNESSLWTSNGNNIFYTTGNVGIGTITPGNYELAVNGEIRAKEVKVETANWPDYVFEKVYALPSLEEVQEHIAQKGHLPNIPSAKEIESNGLELGEMNRLLLEKIEEIMLYTIQQQKEIDELRLQIQNNQPNEE
ncbi:concanavalin A-like lectin/glucanase superfamily protein [Maribacter caenipelagi]|uniref:Concanavalin A-like lectin/glucanase superfamily protein n=1 Tax=Maribacter caenipelagi TaxID=1447781 RepID=A0A4R7DHB9_9FLAO|nr:LamG domain-containing protein [Maribacter caenipelagi]TDS20880.1 concanavalin A-like lectin/glucanase superfamily protein [Maribacter caenipelagi]